MRASAHYIFAFIVLTIYGGQVCPYIDTLDVLQWALILIITLGAASVIRWRLQETVVARRPYDSQARWQFIFELTIFTATGLLVSGYNTAAYDFPPASGAKVMLGFTALGFFAAMDLAMKRERTLSRMASEKGIALMPKEKIFSITGRFSLAASSTVLLMTVVVFLVISRDFVWLSNISEENLMESRLAVLAELLFISVVILIEVLNLIFSFSKNLKLFLYYENTALSAVVQGDFQQMVPVSTNDEFGIMARNTNRMIEDLKKYITELQVTQDVTIMTLADVAEIRDNETGKHILRTQRYVRVLAEKLQGNPAHSDLLDDAAIDLLFKSAPLHDIGKVGIRDAILRKPGKLTDEEFKEMKQHPVYGHDALKRAEDTLGSTSFLRLAKEIAYTHHEKWDGSGYPEGLVGNAIPLPGRLMALADVYDALISKRVYKNAFTHELSSDIIRQSKGSHFDPDVVDAFVAAEETFREISLKYAETQ